jgi:ADP-heptose:LPS heptosyltransferase
MYIENIKDVCSIYDWKKSSLFKIIQSSFQLTYEFHKIGLTKNSYLHITYKDFRDSFYLLNKNNLCFIKHSRNLYQDYDKYFSATFGFKREFSFENNVSLKLVSIFYQSRVADKELPKSLIIDIVDLLNRFNISYQVVHVGHASVKLPSSINQITIKLSFLDTINIINNTSFIIGSDSVVIHLSDLYNVPCFVFMKKFINNYIPYNCLSNLAYSLFSNHHKRLEEFIKDNF